jgi:hypothetical protein
VHNEPDKNPDPDIGSGAVASLMEAVFVPAALRRSTTSSHNLVREHPLYPPGLGPILKLEPRDLRKGRKQMRRGSEEQGKDSAQVADTDSSRASPNHGKLINLRRLSTDSETSKFSNDPQEADLHATREHPEAGASRVSRILLGRPGIQVHPVS